MGTRLFIKEGGDARLPNQPRGFYLQLRAPETRPVNLYTAIADKNGKEGLESAFNLVKKEAREFQASYQIPIMYQDTNPGEGNVIRNLDSFTPEFTV
ncbi:MAG: hypothetical protein Q7R87_01460 [Nanoarchaeota archaeon]|nr:hypothetical protein [Nanoarchaeota archaeon]